MTIQPMQAQLLQDTWLLEIVTGITSRPHSMSTSMALQE